MRPTLSRRFALRLSGGSWRVLGLAAAVLFGAVGCTWYRPTRTPLPTVTFQAGRAGESVYALLLPGRGDVPRDYARARFPERLVEAGFRGEIVAADAHLQYYLQGGVIDRLHQDVVRPRVDRAPWLVGISLGGLGALLFEKEHPGTARGLVLIAPYLGEPGLIREIEDAGGLAAWEPGSFSPDDTQRALWAWIKAGGLARVPVYLAWGRSDRFARANRLLAGILPPGQVVEVPGGHTWSAWKPAFDALVARGACGVAVSSTPQGAAHRGGGAAQ